MNHRASTCFTRRFKSAETVTLFKKSGHNLIGHNLRKDEYSVARQAMQWNPLNAIGRKKGDLVRPGDELWKGSARV